MANDDSSLPKVNPPNPTVVPSGQSVSGGNVTPPSLTPPTGYQVPSLKEQREMLTNLKSQEKGMDTVRYKEYKEVEIGSEVKDWMDKLENGDSSLLNQPVVDDYGQILLDNSTPQKPQIVLPLHEEEVEKAMHRKVIDSIRWLAEWCLRVIKIVGKRATFSK